MIIIIHARILNKFSFGYMDILASSNVNYIELKPFKFEEKKPFYKEKCLKASSLFYIEKKRNNPLLYFIEKK